MKRVLIISLVIFMVVGVVGVRKSYADRVDDLIEQLLNDKDSSVRSNAIEALGKIGEPAVESLIGALSDEDGDVRWGATKALGKIGDARAVEPLIGALSDEDGDVRWGASEALGEIGDARAVEPLIGVLSDEDYSVRRKASEALGEIGDARAVEPLSKALLEDEDSYVRQSAVWALRDIGGSRAVEPLIKALLEDESSSVRKEAAKTLGEIGGPRAVEPLIKTLLEDKNEDVLRRTAAEVLGELGDPKAVEPLIETLLEDVYLPVREAEKDALLKIGKPAVELLIQTLLENISSDSYVRGSTAEALGKIGDSRAVEPLKEAIINDGMLEVRQIARDALYKIIDKNILNEVERLIIDLRGGDTDERIAAAEGLLKIGKPAVEPLIKALLNDEDSDVREVVAKSLSKINTVYDNKAISHLSSSMNFTITGQLLDESGDPVRFARMEFDFSENSDSAGGGSSWSGNSYYLRGGGIHTITDENGRFFILLPEEWVIGEPGWSQGWRDSTGWSITIPDYRMEPIKVGDTNLGSNGGVDIVFNINIPFEINIDSSSSNTGLQLNRPDFSSIVKILSKPEFNKYAISTDLKEDDVIGGFGALQTVFDNEYFKRLIEIEAEEGYFGTETDSVVDEISFIAAIFLFPSTENISILIRDLTSQKESYREFAFNSLVLIGGPTVELLQEFIRSGEGSEEAMDLAGQVLQILDAEIPETVVEEPTVEELIQQLSSDDKDKVIEATEKLAEEKAISAAEPMIELLGSKDSKIRDTVINSLESILPEIEEQQLIDVVSGVLELEKAETTAEKIEKVTELEKLGDIRALPSLIRTLDKDGSSLRLATLNAIVSFGEEAIDVLNIYKDDTEVGNYVTTAIDMIEDDMKIAEERKRQEAVMQLSSDDKKEVLSAISAIKQYGMIEATEPLLKLLGDIDKDIQDAAKGALSTIQSNIEDETLSNIVDNVLILTDTTLDTQERVDAALTLGQIADPIAVDAMVRTLVDDDLDVVFANIKGLINIGEAAIESLTEYIDDVEIGKDIEYVLSKIENNDTGYEEDNDATAFVPSDPVGFGTVSGSIF